MPMRSPKQLDSESDLTIRRALLLSLGESGEKDYRPGQECVTAEKC